VVYPDGDSATNDYILTFTRSGEAGAGFDDPTTDASGEFAISVPSDTETVLAFEQAGFRRDGVPDLYTLAGVDPSFDVALGELTLPTAHVLTVTVVDDAGDPVEDASVAIRHRNDGRSVGTIAETNEQGEFDIGPDSAPPGYEVVGNVSVAVTPPDGDAAVATRDLSVDGDRDLTISLGEIPDGAVYEPGSIADEYDGQGDDRDGLISVAELNSAAADFTNDEISLDDLQNVAAAFVMS